MAKQKIDTTADWKLYEKGIDYNNSLSPKYYDNVNRNERFYAGDHWNGINANGLPKFTLPIFKRDINYFVSSIMSSNVKMSFNVENTDTTDPNVQYYQQMSNALSEHASYLWEKNKMDMLTRDVLLDGAISGDMCFYTYWDDSIDTGQTYGQTVTYDEYGNETVDQVPIMGDFVTETIDGGQVFFGNPNDRRVNVYGKPHQPYILLAGRDMVKNLRAEAKKYRKENGLSDDEINTLIVPDDDTEEQAGDRGKQELENRDSEYGRASYVIKLWPENGTIHFNKSTKAATIRKGVDMGITLYPVAWGNWDKRKNSYHGQAPGTGMVENQIQMNTAFSKVFYQMTSNSFPKVLYDKNAIRTKPSNRVGEIIGIDKDAGASLQNYYYETIPRDITSGTIEIIEMAFNKTQELLGANDAALGNVDNPENSSAILAVQKANAVPLENTKQYLYQMIEDLGYIWQDFMLHKYTVPRQIIVGDTEAQTMVEFDASQLQDAKMRIKIDVGPSSYWSELASLQTLDNLLQLNKISTSDYLERIPNGYIPKKQELVDKLKQQEAIQQQMEQQQQALQLQAQAINAAAPQENTK